MLYKQWQLHIPNTFCKSLQYHLLKSVWKIHLKKTTPVKRPAKLQLPDPSIIKKFAYGAIYVGSIFQQKYIKWYQVTRISPKATVSWRGRKKKEAAACFTFSKSLWHSSQGSNRNMRNELVVFFFFLRKPNMVTKSRGNTHFSKLNRNQFSSKDSVSRQQSICYNKTTTIIIPTPPFEKFTGKNIVISKSSNAVKPLIWGVWWSKCFDPLFGVKESSWKKM